MSPNLTKTGSRVTWEPRSSAGASLLPGEIRGGAAPLARGSGRSSGAPHAHARVALLAPLALIALGAVSAVAVHARDARRPWGSWRARDASPIDGDVRASLARVSGGTCHAGLARASRWSLGALDSCEEGEKAGKGSGTLGGTVDGKAAVQAGPESSLLGSLLNDVHEKIISAYAFSDPYPCPLH